jgi:hypothetical protein
MVHLRLLLSQPLSQLRNIGQEHQRLEYNLLFLLAGVVVLVPERPELLLEDGKMLAVPGLSESGQVEVTDRGRDVALVGERGREVEQKAVAGEYRVDVLALGVFLVALVRLVEQDVPLPVVVIVAEVDDAFLLLGAKIEWKWATTARNLLKLSRLVVGGTFKPTWAV